MLKGILLGSASALALSALLMASVALIVPAPERGSRPVAALPEAPVLRDQAENAPRVPDRPVVDRPVEEARVAPESTPVAAPTETRSAAVSSVDLPAASQFNRPPEDRAAVTPGVDATARPVAVAEGLRDLATPGAEPTPDTQSAALPQTSNVAGFGSAPEVGDAPAVPRSLFDAAPQTFGFVPTGDNAVAEAIDDGLDVALATEPVRPTPDVFDEETAAVEPASVPSVEANDLARTQSTAAEADPVETAQITVVDTPVIVPRAEPAPEPEPEEAVMPRRLVLDSERQEETDEDEAVVDAAEEARTPNALIDFAADFTNPESLPLMSVVLIDDPTSDVGRDSLTAFDFPVTFAIDPTRADAADAARTYRAAGFEVVALADIFPLGATPQDIEIAMSAMRQTLPEAVGVLDRADRGIVENRDALAALLPSLGEAGMGLLAYPGGLNSGVTTARREGVAATTLYRVIDDGGDRAPVMVRFLDRATFEAAQDGATVVLGRADSETIAALYSWRLGNRADQVAPAPLSAVLRRTLEN